MDEQFLANVIGALAAGALAKAGDIGGRAVPTPMTASGP
jgi:hypothetical protein